MRLYFCGVRGSSPDPGVRFVRYGGHTSCVAVAHDADSPPTLLLDGGTGLRNVTPLLAGAPFRGTILLTHVHWDHFQGLPLFGAGDRDDAEVSLFVPADDARTTPSNCSRGRCRHRCFPSGRASCAAGSRLGSSTKGRSTPMASPSKPARSRTRAVAPSATASLTDVDAHVHPGPLPDPPWPGAGRLGRISHRRYRACRRHRRANPRRAHPRRRDPNRSFLRARRCRLDYAVGLAAHARARTVVLTHHRLDRSDDALDALASRYAGEVPRVIVAVEQTTLDLN
jgi:hypothetical protein